MSIYYSLGTRQFYCNCPKDGGPQYRWILVPRFNKNNEVISLNCLVCKEKFTLERIMIR
jgi:hypothetical protein